MRALRRAWSRLVGTVAGRRRERDAAEEFECHIDMLTEENLRRGMSPDEARRSALLTFGNIEVARERYHDERGLPSLDSFQRDIRYAFRGMRRNPVFTAIAIACLALGIGANTAIFSLVSAVMLRQLPVKHPEQLAFFQYAPQSDMRAVRESNSGYGNYSFPYATYEALRTRASTLDGAFVFAPVGSGGNGLTVSTGSKSIGTAGEMVTGGYFSVLGISPVAGRMIAEADLNPQSPNVAVISHRFWVREFSGERSAIGRSITLNGTLFTIIGVAPEGFAGLTPGQGPDLWVPLRPTPDLMPWGSRLAAEKSAFTDRRYWWCTIVGRRRPGVTQSQVQSEGQLLFHQSITADLQQVPQNLPNLVVSQVCPVSWMLRRGFTPTLRILMVTAGLVLLIACVNVAMLLLARAKARQREIGIRLATGANRARLVRQLLTESVILSMCGGGLGLLLAYWGGPALLRLIPGHRMFTLDVRPDATVLAFAFAVSVATGILFGLAPAFRASRVDVVQRITETSVSATPRLGMGRLLVATQVALSFVLLFGAGLFLRTFQNLNGQNLGLKRENLLLFEVDPGHSGYKAERGIAIHLQLAERLEAIPGVRSVSFSEIALLSGTKNTSPSWTDGGVPPIPGKPNEVHWNRVGPHFFETMGIRMLLGSEITLHDADTNRATAVVNEAWAREYYPDRNPIGHRISSGEQFNPLRSYEIVGVVENAKYDSLRESAPRTVYFSYAAPWERPRRMCFALRTVSEPMAITASVREAIRQIDPNLPLFNMRTQDAQISETLGMERMLAQGSSLFGALALLLVAVGVYGTISYTVAQRTGEIGIRMALGASRASVVWMILRGALVSVAWGLAAGLPVALILARLASSTFYGVKTYDPLTMVATILILWSVAAVSGFAPATRASGISPMQALRHE